MKQISIFISVMIGILLIGCAGSKPSERLPVPKSDEFTLYARGLSTDQQIEEMADRASELQARNALASAIETHIRSLTKQAAEQVGIGNDSEQNRLFSQAIKATVDQTLVGSVVHSAAVTRWDKRTAAFRAEVVMKIDVSAVNQSMIDNLKQRQLLYQRLRTGELFRELEEDIEKERAAPESAPEPAPESN